MSRALVVSATLLAACASGNGNGWTTLNRPALRARQAHAIRLEVEEPPSVTFESPGVAHVVAPMLSALGDASRGSSLSPRLRDPSGKVGAGLVRLLARRFSLTVVDQATSTDLILRLRTVQWIVTCPASSAQCQTNYHAALSLIDRRDGAVLAAGECSKGFGDRVVTSESAFSRDLDVAVIQSMLDEAGGACVEEYRTELLGLL